MLFGRKMNIFSITKRLLRLVLVLFLFGFLFFSYFKPEKSISPLPHLHTFEHGNSNVSEINFFTEPYRFSPKDTSWYPVNTKPSQTSDPRSLDTEPIYLTKSIYEPGHRDNEIDVENICKTKGVDVKLLILITSRVSGERERNAIRKTWKYYDFRQDIGIAFVLGRSSSEHDIKSLDRENLMYADMIRGNSIDSYRNLTLKTISLLEWAHRHCPYAKYVLKTNDDVFINVPRLLSFIDKNKANRTIFGRRIDGSRPVRNRASKYYLSINEYPTNTFPNFTTGPAYLITGDIVHELYKQSLNLLYIHLEDVYITGMVAEMLGIERVFVKEIYNLRSILMTCFNRNQISIHMVEPPEQLLLWNNMFDETIKCRIAPLD